LVLLGIYDRCTPALAAEISLLAAMLGSLDAVTRSRTRSCYDLFNKDIT
jgi:hypothetical protein